ncbi:MULTISPECIES: bacteriohopanetetrol glucosamine biosynthesis glycosyltransferase HpnI [Methylorubrum]|jgi:ceramide glucosyltransferase|uniref:Hopanoid biosynthesis associated glycosyl transferase protein HpnI n=2 Tax=Methylorubrum extorquens TaxID=408 RepID=H1KLH5_METEX|nr:MULTISPECIES: bacteriohopanetetrol glucosamine biosynthesis glycosyltransferase HpnI [Methylorubrum]ACS41396.1 putative glycosyl transferase, putative membrane-associated protein [Methylorubrum extorquens AM1]EHP91620.1 hopanoid biosynthesis associated glycosyl transferase protein HpnI [Methylorubrum extorquens DSM 13060]MCP1540422.1 ceramide glucosyltransferase [Methylorubrum extorquens]MCP1587041.1 ceramide glucosyltransferase [Methylorubrum extorquens]BDL40837.1 glucosyltransferase [Meth
MDLNELPAWIASVLLLMALAGCVYALLAAWLVDRFAARPSPALAADAPRPGVTILKPLCGLEPDLFENLGSFCRQDYAGPVQIVFGVQNAADPAIAVVQRLREAHPALRLDLVVDPSQHGSNRKVSNLINMSERIAHAVVVLADSDMSVKPDYLERVAAALSQPGISGVTCLYHGVPGDRGMCAQLAALAIDVQFVPNVILGTTFDLARPCFGSTIAMTAESLARIGGFRAFKDDLADDYAIGEALRAEGGTVAIPALTIGHACVDTELSGLWRHELRWNRTIRNVDPKGYAGSVVTHAFPLALLAALMPGAGSGALAVAALALTCRILLCLRIERAFGLSPHAYWLLPIRDMLSFINFTWSFVSGAVTWKGHDYRVVADGTLIPEHGLGRESRATSV